VGEKWSDGQCEEHGKETTALQNHVPHSLCPLRFE
jgi:hypothetical protein